MHYEDRMTIDTPEGVSMTLALAGVGSRFVAAGVDVTIQSLLLGASAVLFVVYGAAGAASGGAFAICFFLIFFVYDVAFEVLAGGRTPGKRWNGLRVVRTGGQPIGFVASVIRNLLRVIDLLPGFYLVGMVSILVTRRNQRLGDLAAGTVVARAPRRALRPVLAPAQESAPAPPLAGQLAAWDVSAITSEELATVRAFLERRRSLTFEARVDLARTMAARLRPRVGGLPAGAELGDELFLERLAQVKASRG
jgi:uncharacterized RDD family membrane protein YckC